MSRARIAGSPSDRFWARVAFTFDGCWLWTSALDDEGYGRLKVAGKRRLAHDLIMEAIHGPLPVGLETDHLCRVRHCVNPTHLERVTHEENMRRSRGKRKDYCSHGHRIDGFKTSTGLRYCKTCSQIDCRQRRQRQRENHV